MFLAMDLAMPPVSCHACGHVFCHAHTCCADTAGVTRGRRASDYVIASNSLVTELSGPGHITGFDGEEHSAIYAKVVAQTTVPANLPSLRALPEEVLAQARDVIQGSVRNVVRQPRASTPGQEPQLEDWEEEPPQPQAPPEPQQPQERQPMQLPPLPPAPELLPTTPRALAQPPHASVGCACASTPGRTAVPLWRMPKISEEQPLAPSALRRHVAPVVQPKMQAEQAQQQEQAEQAQEVLPVPEMREMHPQSAWAHRSLPPYVHGCRARCPGGPRAGAPTLGYR